MTVMTRNLASLRTRTKMNRMVTVISPPEGRFCDLPEELLRRPKELPLKEPDKTVFRLRRQQIRRNAPVKTSWPTSCKIEMKQLHPVSRQMVKLREEMRTKLSTMVQVGQAHQY